MCNLYGRLSTGSCLPRVWSGCEHMHRDSLKPRAQGSLAQQMGKVGRELTSVWIKLQENLRRTTPDRKLPWGEPGAERKTTLLLRTTKDFRMQFMTVRA